MASARIRERTKARQSAARKAGIRKAPRKTLHGKLLQLPSSPRSMLKRRGQHGPVEASPAGRPKQVKTRSLAKLTAGAPAVTMTADAGTLHTADPNAVPGPCTHEIPEVVKIQQQKDSAIWQTPLHAGASVHSWLGGIVMALRARLRR